MLLAAWYALTNSFESAYTLSFLQEACHMEVPLLTLSKSFNPSQLCVFLSS